MVTNTRMLRELELETVRPELPQDWLSQFFRRASNRAGQLRCGLTGHNVLIRYQPTRLSLQCSTCGYESPGWDLKRGAAQETAPLAASDHGLLARSPSRIGPPIAA